MLWVPALDLSLAPVERGHQGSGVLRRHLLEKRPRRAALDRYRRANRCPVDLHQRLPWQHQLHAADSPQHLDRILLQSGLFHRGFRGASFHTPWELEDMQPAAKQQRMV